MSMNIRTPLAAAMTAVVLLVATGCAVSRGQETTGAYIDDANITTQVLKNGVFERDDLLGLGAWNSTNTLPSGHTTVAAAARRCSCTWVASSTSKDVPQALTPRPTRKKLSAVTASPAVGAVLIQAVPAAAPTPPSASSLAAARCERPPAGSARRSRWCGRASFP